MYKDGRCKRVTNTNRKEDSFFLNSSSWQYYIIIYVDPNFYSKLLKWLLGNNIQALTISIRSVDAIFNQDDVTFNPLC